MLTAALLTIVVFAAAMTFLAIGMILRGKPLRGSCCGGRNAAAGDADAPHIRCATCPEDEHRQFVQISTDELHSSNP